MSDDVVVRDRVALALWRFACPPKLRDEWAGDPPPPVFVRMADAVVAELAAIRAESPARRWRWRNVEVMDRAGFMARYGQGDAERVPPPSDDALRAAGAFMAAMEAEERWRSSLPPVGSAVEWERASDGGGAPIALVVVEGPSAGAVVALDRPSLVIGRAEGCDVRLAGDELVSPRHARLSCEALDGRWPAGRWVIEDLGSVNGVFVGGTRAFVRLPVAVGVRVQVGRSVFVLR